MARVIGQIDLSKNEAILDAAVDVLGERGITAPMEEIARRAHVSKQTIYNHYGSKAELVRALPETIAFTAFTHSPTIAAEFERLKNVEVNLIGGRLYRHSMVAVGTQAALAIGLLRPDLFFMGVTAANSAAGFSTGDAEEAAIKRLIARQSRDVWVLLTAEKLGLQSPVTIMPLVEAAGVVVSASSAEGNLATFEEAGVSVRKSETPTASR